MSSNNYPTSNFYGQKKELISNIFQYVPAETRTFVDLFSGSSVVSWNAKQRGHQVLASDVMLYPVIRFRALVENDDVLLSDSDLDMLAAPNVDRQDWCVRWYGAALGLDNAKFIDLLAANALRLDDPRKADIVIYVAVLTIMQHMHYCSVKFSPTGEFSGWRDLDDFFLPDEFRDYTAKQFPSFIFATGIQHRAEQSDALDYLDTIPQADVLYCDSPYSSPASQYAAQYAFYDKISLILLGKANLVITPCSGKPPMPAHVNFANREQSLAGFGQLFWRASRNCRRIIVSYNKTSSISPDQITHIGKLHFGDRVAYEEIPTSNTTTSRFANRNPAEVIMVFDNRNPPANQFRNTTAHVAA